MKKPDVIIILAYHLRHKAPALCYRPPAPVTIAPPYALDEKPNMK
jgi:hypothetical protein